MPDFLAAIDAEISALEQDVKTVPDPRTVKLGELRRLRALYAPKPSPKKLLLSPSPHQLSSISIVGMARAGAAAADFLGLDGNGQFTVVEVKNRGGRQISQSTLECLNMAEAFITGRRSPTPTAHILHHLHTHGIVVPGVKPQNNLSAMLSKDRKRFKAHGRAGWTLASNARLPEKGETADAKPVEGTSAVSIEPGLTSRGTH